jgi:Leucine-rich repeat (LRR) protein
MTIKELHSELIEAYSVNNLNTISLTLINLFKTQQYKALQKISDIISDYVDISIGNDGKGFNRLMMLYHPDRAVYHVTEINKLAAENNFDGLMKYRHILKLGRIGEIESGPATYEDFDYSPVYDWDMSDLEEEGFRIFDVNEPDDEDLDSPSEPGCTFIEAVRIRHFDQNGDLLFFIQEIEELEMSSYGIDDLEGIQYCKNARSIDLSNNKISDLLPLTVLKELEDLDLSDNEIGYIDDIVNLKGLRSIMLSNNYIQDISPLFELDLLEYADLAGNNIDSDQLQTLIELGVTVNY